MDEGFKKQVDATDAEGKRRFGDENWATMMDALRRANPNGSPKVKCASFCRPATRPTFFSPPAVIASWTKRRAATNKLS